MASHRKALEASMGLGETASLQVRTGPAMLTKGSQTAASAWRFVTDEDFAKAAKEEFKRSAA